MAAQCDLMDDLATAGILNNYVWCHYCEAKGFYKIVGGNIMIDETKQPPYPPFKPYNPAVINNDPNCLFKVTNRKMLKTHLTQTDCEPSMQDFYRTQNEQRIADKKSSFEPSKTKTWPQYILQMPNADFDVVTERINDIFGTGKEKYNM